MKKTELLLILFLTLISFLLPVYAGAEDAADETDTQPEYTEEKVIYLTYDDGPSIYTVELLDLLDEYDAKATFFVIGGSAARMPEPVKDAAERGHAVGIHCYIHRLEKNYMSAEAFEENIDRTAETITEITGQSPCLFRFVGGSLTAYSYTQVHINGGFEAVKQSLDDKGLTYFDWDVTCDETTDGAEGALFRVKRCCQAVDSPVVLMHDTHCTSIAVTRKILKWGRENGYTFRSLDESVPERHSILRTA